MRLPDIVLVADARLGAEECAVKVNDLQGDRRPLAGPHVGIEELGDALVAVLSRELSQSASRLLSVDDVEYYLACCESAAPVTVRTVLACVSLEDLTRILRGLLQDHWAILHLPLILEDLLRLEYVPVDTSALELFDPRRPVSPTTSPAELSGWRWSLRELEAVLWASTR
jgi:type III secretory pathway component EscV